MKLILIPVEPYKVSFALEVAAPKEAVNVHCPAPVPTDVPATATYEPSPPLATEIIPVASLGNVTETRSSFVTSCRRLLDAKANRLTGRVMKSGISQDQFPALQW